MAGTATGLKNPVRVLMNMLRVKETKSVVASVSPSSNILNEYRTIAPDNQSALDIFAGEWSSRFPGEFSELNGGSGLPLFEDLRIAWGLAELGGVVNEHVLELGPLEGGHSYMLEKAGAASVTAIEANTRAFMKCLITKEILGLTKTRFLCGDFLSYLRGNPPSFDMCLASGVLYHMREPAELLGLISQVTRRLILWTHYYDEVIIPQTPHLAHRFSQRLEMEYKGFRHIVYRHEYAEALQIAGYCGGNGAYSCWMPRDEILRCLRYFGFTDIRIHMEHPDFVNGPCFLLAARKK